MKELGIPDLVSEIKRVESYPDFEKVIQEVIQHGLQRFIFKHTEGKVSQRRQTILVIFCRGESIAY